jgi:mevalonate kinase
VHVLQTMTICVGLSGRPRDTAAQVAAVARLRDRMSATNDVLALLGRLAADAEAALASGDIDGLGRILDAAHGLLAALRLSSPELDTLVHGARAAGAIGAKLTGAGGGGAVIALAPGHERDVLVRWRAGGFDGFTAEIAATETFAKRVAT